MISISEQIACVRRELGMRHRAYPRWIANGRMTEQKAHEEIAAMEAVLVTLHKVEATERLI